MTRLWRKVIILADTIRSCIPSTVSPYAPWRVVLIEDITGLASKDAIGQAYQAYRQHVEKLIKVGRKIELPPDEPDPGMLSSARHH